MSLLLPVLFHDKFQAHRSIDFPLPQYTEDDGNYKIHAAKNCYSQDATVFSEVLQCPASESSHMFLSSAGYIFLFPPEIPAVLPVSPHARSDSLLLSVPLIVVSPPAQLQLLPLPILPSARSSYVPHPPLLLPTSQHMFFPIHFSK